MSEKNGTNGKLPKKPVETDGPEDADGLNPRQRKFVNEYLLDLNATRAYKAAGYGVSSEASASANACTLKANYKVQAVLAREMARLEQLTQVKQEWVIRKLREEAVLGETGGSRVKALELLGKHIGMFGESLTVNGQVNHQHEHTHTVKVEQFVNGLSPELRLRLLGELESPLLLPAQVSSVENFEHHAPPPERPAE